jgi:hypothetical protein
MRVRCEDPDHDSYLYYGGRGIKVCARWNNYKNFLADMGRRPSSSHTLDRIDSDGNYEPGNCRWSTWDEQVSNRRTPYGTKVGGVKLTEQNVLEIRRDNSTRLEVLAERYGVCRTTIHNVRRGRTWKHLLSDGGGVEVQS